MAGEPMLRGERVVLRPAVVADAERFAEIVHEPGVAPWWMDYDAERFAREIAGDPCERGAYLAMEAEGAVVGLMDYYEEDDPDYRYAGMDISIADEWQGRGFGTDALRTLARWLIEERGHHRLVIDPAVENSRAIHVYEKVGFKPVGVMRSYERRPGDRWRDGLLMDLLADELT